MNSTNPDLIKKLEEDGWEVAEEPQLGEHGYYMRAVKDDRTEVGWGNTARASILALITMTKAGS